MINQPAEPNPAPADHIDPHAPAEIPVVGADLPSSPEASLPERIFMAPDGLRVGWSLLLYFGLSALIKRVFDWLGASLFPDPHGAARLWTEMYNEGAALVAALPPAFLLARIENRPFDDYGLPRKNAFGRLFWVGAVWGFVWITALLMLLHGACVFEFGPVSLHGARLVRFAAFWAVYFLLVGLFEEFFVRGYVLFTLSRRIGFWAASALLSAAFGALHLGNRGENFTGALGAALIGLFFCLTLRRTGSLWFAVGFHAAWDWGETFFYGVPDSGTTEPGHFLSPKFHGPAWLTGGSVGPEASTLLLLIVAAMWLAFDRRYREAKFLSGNSG